MAVTSSMYGKFLLSLLNKEIDYESDDIYAAVITNAYTPNQDTHQYWSDVVAHELVGTGYTANGKLLVGKSMPYSSGDNKVTLDCDDLSWTGTTWSAARYLVFYDRTPGSDATRPLICWVDFGADQSTSSQPFTYVVPTTGFAQGSIT